MPLAFTTSYVTRKFFVTAIFPPKHWGRPFNYPAPLTVRNFLLVRRDAVDPGVTLLEAVNPRRFGQVLIPVEVGTVLHDIDQELSVAVLAVSDEWRELNRVNVQGVRFRSPPHPASRWCSLQQQVASDHEIPVVGDVTTHLDPVD